MRVLGALLAAAVVTTAPLIAQADSAYVAELQARARSNELATAPQWLRLGHWRTSFWRSGWRSEADGQEFFLSEQGKNDPAAELDATLAAFFADVEVPDEHATCRFPARFLWLAAELQFDPARLKVRSCPAFEEYLRQLRPQAIVLVFSSYYMSRAASAFGHSFLRVEKRAEKASDEKRQLLDFGIDYSANVSTDNSILYAWLGVTGGFAGTFKRLPYYYKVREYNDYESRDLWEYHLNLTPAQVTMAVAHIWELGGTYFDYFYLTENCSYHILSVVEVANPELELVDQLKTPVIPADTVKTLFTVPGLVADVRYRPSLMTQFRHRAKALSERELTSVETLADDPEAELTRFPEQRRRLILDAAADLVDIKFGDDVLGKPESHGARAKHRLLTRRAAMGLASVPLVIEPPWHKQPQVGHGSRRVGFGVGSAEGVGQYLALDLRLTLHDLADPPPGYPELSQIEFLPMRGRFYLDGGEFSLEQISLVRIVQLNPIDRFTRRMSWKLDVGGSYLRDAGCDGCWAGGVVYGGGLAMAAFNDALALWATADLHAKYAPRLHGLKDAPFRLGLGGGAGARLRWHARALSVVTADWIWLPAQTPVATWSVDAHTRIATAPNIAIDLGTRVRSGSIDGQLSLLLYY